MDRKWLGSPVESTPKRSGEQRRLRVGEELRHVLSGLLSRGECRDPALRDSSIAVTEVRFSPDLRSAIVFVMPLGGANATEVVAGLKRSTPFLKRLVAREMALRRTPNMAFELDHSFDQANRIAALLARPDVERDCRHNVAQTKSNDNAN